MSAKDVVKAQLTKVSVLQKMLIGNNVKRKVTSKSSAKVEKYRIAQISSQGTYLIL